MRNLLGEISYNEKQKFETVCGCSNQECLLSVPETYNFDVEKDYPIIAENCTTVEYSANVYEFELIG